MQVLFAQGSAGALRQHSRITSVPNPVVGLIIPVTYVHKGSEREKWSGTAPAPKVLSYAF